MPEVVQARLQTRDAAGWIEVSNIQVAINAGVEIVIILVEPHLQPAALRSRGDWDIDEPLTVGSPWEPPVPDRDLEFLVSVRLSIPVLQLYPQLNLGRLNGEQIRLAGGAQHGFQLCRRVGHSNHVARRQHVRVRPFFHQFRLSG